MIQPGKKIIVILGMMTKIPVAGVVWNTIHYMVGLERLGYEVYYVEEHARTPSMFIHDPEEDGSLQAATFIANAMQCFGFGGRWAYRALHADGRCFGMDESKIKQIHRSAELIINLHGGTVPLPEHSATGRLVFLETDPVDLQLELHEGRRESIEFLQPHVAFFTWGQNYGNPDCYLPVSQQFHFQPTRPPVILDFWHPHAAGPAEAFTTIGNWRQRERSIVFQGETYTWSKHVEFRKIADLPQRTPQPFELALNSYLDEDRQMLESKGWKVRSATEVSFEVDPYREYIATSRGEFTVAKDQNVRLRSGWFSERSATYLAAGRPVINQDTGFSSVLPVGEGLFGFSTIDDVLDSVDRINQDYDRHCRAAFEIAHDYFSYDVVLAPMLEYMGLPHSSERARGRTLPAVIKPFPPTLDLRTTSRWPTRLPERTEEIARISRAQGHLPGYDVVCLAPIFGKPNTPWEAMLDQLALSGHRVFYLKVDADPASAVSTGVPTPMHGPNVFEARVPERSTPPLEGDMSEEQVAICLSILDTLRREHNIETGVLYAHTPAQALLAFRARELWGWKVVYPARITRKELDEANRVTYGCDAPSHAVADGYMRWGPAGPGAPPGSPTWLQRWAPVDDAIRATYTSVSIIIAVHNGLTFTRLCLESILANTEYPAYEVILVDNASTDGTREYVRDLAARHSHIHGIFQSDNLGFAAATNRGLTAATGNVLVLLNNDTLVPSGWLTRLVRPLDESEIGLVGPVTNRIANEAQIAVPYNTYDEFLRWSNDRARAYRGQAFDIPVLLMFCLAMRRDVYHQLGELDERFAIGMFEDDDYAMRARAAGYRVICLEDTFVHHFGQATIGDLADTGNWGSVFESNRLRFEEKWGVAWSPHSGRQNVEYEQLVRRIREVVHSTVPPGASVLVISKGDSGIVSFEGREGRHFPQEIGGSYAGHYPESSEAAICHLEALRDLGADFLLIPGTASWWLDHYAGLKVYLENHFKPVACDDDACVIYALRAQPAPAFDRGPITLDVSVPANSVGAATVNKDSNGR